MKFSSPDEGFYNQFNYDEICGRHVMLASDGIWDNLFTHEIKAVLKESRNLLRKENDFPDPHFPLHFAVDKLISMTKKKYEIQNYESPFYVKAK